jgi:hypothetical protein
MQLMLDTKQQEILAWVLIDTLSSLGLCTPACIADIAPNLVALYASRAQGAHFTEKPEQLAHRIKEIADGQYDTEWERLLAMTEQQLEDVCAGIK